MAPNTQFKILSIDTSCDETAAAVTEGKKVLSNIIWSQASLHAKFGGVYPSLAKRMHKERIGWVIEKAIKNSKVKIKNIDSIAVTVGPGLAIALEVGIKKALEFAEAYNKPLIPINHVEGHILSVLAHSRNLKSQISNLKFPALAFVASGGTTQLILVYKIGDYKILAQTSDDSLGEALDKAARMLGLGYPGGAILEKMAKKGNSQTYPLPIPMLGQEDKFVFSYSGLKTAFYKLVEKEKPLNQEKIQNLAASFQDKAFKHAVRIIQKVFDEYPAKEFWFGGGVAANLELKKRLRFICKQKGMKMLIPYSKKLCTDNAAMIGISAYYRFKRKKFLTTRDFDKVDRIPRAKVDKKLPW
ncbi:tRNA (adenosine(37)-N6)-threonylcarbamoyltransferase complex transferase subunit TsaD [Candidatus Woesebacteria bacterium RIFCSPLOWO2_01_FULL_37_19]|uniref:tRNA N6-adenosine threonylcarbamoyltransferase n=2 Tax=Candidatus Woeseibacteriota TaxID=1752722 RepID=A0A1F8AYN3_9BACT|nr:MAG: tRNA (adenosine(37)-N6)-threonylcarbamoyltransferase complex transferase subunit TsaD [Candidatus Woesebacteria bacterium RIFCSPHIGHO2_01_FULL_38_26b]OGM56619.1 MAG: tRNA (adenosine(37)-N6)-threonylcarbamoyltransferase complex transferase subunit TsaD [Candidatus Woesebacteria bacterium RIFCSPLOWO2_01_FULL_37_19]